MKSTARAAWALAAVLAGGAARGADDGPVSRPAPAPSPAEVQRVWDYYYRGGAGPVLVDVKLCSEMGREGGARFECVKELGPEGARPYSTVYVWQSYLLPQGAVVDDLAVQLKQGDTVRETRDVRLKGEGWRVRTWAAVRVGKPGTWSVSVLRGTRPLRQVTLQVRDAPAEPARVSDVGTP